MAVRELAETLTVWRIGDPDGRFPIYSGEGAALCEGRWHRKGQDIIYTSEHYGTAMLEKCALQRCPATRATLPQNRDTLGRGLRSCY